MIEQDDGA